VRDNGTRTLAELARRVNELSDLAAHESVRTALLRKEMHDRDELLRSRNDQLEEQERYIEALKGHTSGLEHNVDVLNEALVEREGARAAIDAKYRAVLSMKTVQMTAPIRWVYNKLTGASKNAT
jgi:septal ring factor EnvC (AmiA/AmiB activator)